MKAVKIGLLGLGTVGTGVISVLKRNADEIARRAGSEITVVAAAVRDLSKPRDIDSSGIRITDDPMSVVNDPEIDIVVELIGGDGVALDGVNKALENGKHVVTANKALIALHGNEIFKTARSKGLVVAFESAVAGGIPIIKSIREGLSANRIEWLAGIINGTSNYILTQMTEGGRNFDDVLAEAQALGYAEADPAFDIEGTDAAHKLTILASIAFGISLQFDKVYQEGITNISSEDITYAQKFGYRIKHLGLARRTDRGIELRVHPTLIPEQKLIANVNDVMNAVLVQGDAVGPTLYYGAGAGSEPTASSVVADLVDVVRTITTDPENRVPHLAFQPDTLSDLAILPIEEIDTAYYLRMGVINRPGVLAAITEIFGNKGISIETISQKENGDGKEDGEDKVSIILLTHNTKEGHLCDAIKQIEQLDTVYGSVTRLRVETLS
ncbi:MAG: homoserine dehydrogenase [Gammaproteobacteria bacterium]|nr:homoserine dehydrogenase [Gammaproteobacteria bacterium]